MRRTTLPALFAAVALAACSPGDAAPAVDDALERDLQVVQGSAVELAPRAGGQQVVSAIESAPANPQPRPSAPAPRRKSPTPRPPAPTPEPVLAAAEPAEATVDAPAPTEVAAPTPRQAEVPVVAPRPSAPAPQRKAPKGGWWSTGDVIRNAPFPVNP